MTTSWENVAKARLVTFIKLLEPARHVTRGAAAQQASTPALQKADTHAFLAIQLKPHNALTHVKPIGRKDNDRACLPHLPLLEGNLSGSRYLRPMLNAGSSRVFNCNDVARKLEHREGEQNPYLFKTPAMHHLVLVKEAMRYDDPRHPKGLAIGTKLYVPYNRDEIYEGGRS